MDRASFHDVLAGCSEVLQEVDLGFATLDNYAGSPIAFGASYQFGTVVPEPRSLAFLLTAAVSIVVARRMKWRRADR